MNTAEGGFLKRIFTTFASPYGGHVLSGGRSSGSRAPLGAGNANNGGIDGLAYFNGNNAPSTANANLSSSHYFVAVVFALRLRLRAGLGSRWKIDSQTGFGRSGD